MMRRFQSLDEWKGSLLRFPMVVVLGFIAAALSMYVERMPYDQPTMMAEVGIYDSTVGMLLATVVHVSYERFLKDFPTVANRASVNDIASYLLMSPESLSRIRSAVAVKSKK